MRTILLDRYAASSLVGPTRPKRVLGAAQRHCQGRAQSQTLAHRSLLLHRAPVSGHTARLRPRMDCSNVMDAKVCTSATHPGITGENAYVYP